jgi:hypothetical protein
VIGDLLIPFGFIGIGSRFPFARIDRRATMPTREVFAIEQIDWIAGFCWASP